MSWGYSYLHYDLELAAGMRGRRLGSNPPQLVFSPFSPLLVLEEPTKPDQESDCGGQQDKNIMR